MELCWRYSIFASGINRLIFQISRSQHSLDQQHPHHWACQKCEFLGPIPDPLKQKLSEGGRRKAICVVTNLPGDSVDPRIITIIGYHFPKIKMTLLWTRYNTWHRECKKEIIHATAAGYWICKVPFWWGKGGVTVFGIGQWWFPGWWSVHLRKFGHCSTAALLMGRRESRCEGFSWRGTWFPLCGVSNIKEGNRYENH